MTVPPPPHAESRARLESAGPGEAFTESLREQAYGALCRGVVTDAAGEAALAALEDLKARAAAFHLVRPVVMADGFPGHTYDWLYQNLNQLSLLTMVLNAGYDVVILTYADGTDCIQSNAFVLVECLQRVISKRSGQEKLVVAGASMGGIVARYALLYMEKNTPKPIDHQTSLFISFDAPHRGANLPVGVQWMVRYLAAVGEDKSAIAMSKRLSSFAARQLLIYYLAAWNSTGPLVDPLFHALRQELRDNGNYPAIPRKAGIACGSGNGQKVIPDGAQTIQWYGSATASCAVARCWPGRPARWSARPGCSRCRCGRRAARGRCGWPWPPSGRAAG
jgi:pimeloyl-ACP methyl ester carboxylesterase